MSLRPRDEKEIWERIRANEVRLEERFHAATVEQRSLREATQKATDALDARLNLLNELRGNVLTREEYDAHHETVTQDLHRLSEQRASDVNDLRNALNALHSEIQVNESARLALSQDVKERRAAVVAKAQVLYVLVAVLSVVAVLAIGTQGFTQL